VPEERSVGLDELLSALKRYIGESGDSEQAAAFKIGVNQFTLNRWLCGRQRPKKGKAALTAEFLRRAGYL
jgi:hypothetical protein